MNHVVFYSGGIGSFFAAKRVTEQYGRDNTVLLFTDTKMEDEDLYRFLQESSQHLGAALVRIEEGRNPWEVFKDKRFLGNSRVDPCSQILKRSLARTWIKERYQPDEVELYLGIDWTEIHRYEKAKEHWQPYRLNAPLCDPPYLAKSELLIELEEIGIKRPRLYTLGFPNNNCGGFCVKAGIKQFKLLLEKMPERYQFHEDKEQEIREYLGKDVSILKNRRNKTVKPLTLKDLRLREVMEVDEEWGGCGCFVDVE